MKITITGGSGFIGRKLARALLDDNALGVETLTMVDMVDPPAELTEDARVRAISGDIGSSELLGDAIGADTDAVFHLAQVRAGDDAEETVGELATQLETSPLFDEDEII